MFRTQVTTHRSIVSGMKKRNLSKYNTNDNLSLEDVRKWYKEMEKERICSMYSFPDKPSSDGYYHIYLEDKTKKSGRRQIKAKNLENLRDKVYEFEMGVDGHARKTFKQAFKLTQEEKLKYTKDPEKLLSVKNTNLRNQCDYSRYFKDTEFEEMFVDEITKQDIEDICMYNLRRYDLSIKAFLNMRCIIKSVLTLAYEEYWIVDNPYTRINFSKYNDMLVNPSAPSKRVHTDSEIDKMLDYMHTHQTEHPDYIPAYALELQLLMGLRRGEIAPLMWSDITDIVINITKEQITVHKSPDNPKAYCAIVQHTKTYVDREFPITSEIREFLDGLRNIIDTYYPGTPYLFPHPSNDTGVIDNSVVYRFYYRMCRDLGVDLCKEAMKGPHSFRRNGITKVSNTPGGNIMIASVLYGNSVKSASQHYYTGINMAQARDLLEGNQR